MQELICIGGMMEWYQQGNTEILSEKACPSASSSTSIPKYICMSENETSLFLTEGMTIDL